MKIDFKKSAMLALPVSVAVYVVSWLFGLLNIGVTPLFSSIPATSGVTATVGTKVWGFISGLMPFSLDLTNIFMVYISAFAAIVLGSFLVGQFKLPIFKSFLGMNGNAGKIASYILYGAIPVYLLLVGFTNPGLMAVVGLV